jgi:LysR family glycine cleavage system transcriptional activator
MFGSKWLAKRLVSFQEQYPEVEPHIHFVENNRVSALAGIDVGVQFGPGGWPDKWSALLQGVAIAPTCSPRLLQTGSGLRAASDLTRVALLHQDDGAEWRRWLGEAGLHDVRAFRNNVYCSDLSMAIDLAIEGVGAALGSDVLCAEHIRQGLLVRPFEESIPANGAWYVLCDPPRLDRANARAFIRWLLAGFGRALDAPHVVPDGPASSLRPRP